HIGSSVLRAQSGRPRARLHPHGSAHVSTPPRVSCLWLSVWPAAQARPGPQVSLWSPVSGRARAHLYRRCHASAPSTTLLALPALRLSCPTTRSSGPWLPFARRGGSLRALGGRKRLRMEVAAILWRRLDTPGHDACRLERSDAGWELDGTAVFREDG